ncbi:hypothetical protein I3760_11G182200 [Carya illinoinensis]|nr:hypothetical protein I3760_11G182200 [Carya illinoinensis]
MDKEVRRHLEIHWQGKQEVKVLPLAKILTFDIICSILFGLEQGGRREAFVACFQEIIEGMWSVPINLPFTRYNCSLRASARVQNMLKDAIREKIVELEHKAASPHQGLITCLPSIRNEDNEEALTVDEIVHNIMVLMVAGFDTSSVLLTFIIRLLANEPAVYAFVVQGIHKTLPSPLSLSHTILKSRSI